MSWRHILHVRTEVVKELEKYHSLCDVLVLSCGGELKEGRSRQEASCMQLQGLSFNVILACMILYGLFLML